MVHSQLNESINNIDQNINNNYKMITIKLLKESGPKTIKGSLFLLYKNIFIFPLLALL